MIHRFHLVSVCFIAVILTACATSAGEGDTQPSSSDQVATVVAATLSAMPPSISLPTSTSTVFPGLSIDDFPDKILLGEDDVYSVYLINSTSGDAPEKRGEIIILDKVKNVVYQIDGSFAFFGTVIVSHDDLGQYVLLSHGTYISRGAIVISLNDGRQAVNEFCTTAAEFGNHIFWEDYVTFNNCDTFANRPWGAGEAPSIVAVNLRTGLVTEIAKSDLTHHFSLQAITDSSLQYLVIAVEYEEDWQNLDTHSEVVQFYDLSLLGR